MDLKLNYVAELKKRKTASRAHTKHQLIGAEIGELLEDQSHISLYIKLAKEHNPNELLRIAKEVSQNREVRNKGAYFMAMLANMRNDTKARK